MVEYGEEDLEKAKNLKGTGMLVLSGGRRRGGAGGGGDLLKQVTGGGTVRTVSTTSCITPPLENYKVSCLLTCIKILRCQGTS